MARFHSQQVFYKILSTRLLPLFNYADEEVCRELLKACYAAGIRAFELTNRDDSALEVFKRLVPFVDEELPELTLGAGTILNGEIAQQFIDAGADYIIAPTLDPDTAQVCVNNQIPWIPGCFSPSEIHTAYKLGAEVIKLFPAGTLGPEYVRHILAPLPFVRAIVTGAVKLDDNSVRNWLQSGVFALGVGSQMFSKEIIAAKDYELLEEKLRLLVAVASEQ
jgi:2-dehydro-3-deoxyphosphogluconate aldolase / (4S)-4-hydroxy-2-oxoglutarate aldolase